MMQSVQEFPLTDGSISQVFSATGYGFVSRQAEFQSDSTHLAGTS